jgi:hypothetical protein
MPEPDRGQRRETRLLLATIGVSIAMLLLLARFRFPEESRGAPEPAAAPLERLAARATFEELAATMADLERRIEGRIEVLRIQPERSTGGFVPAPRLAPGRAVVVLGAEEKLVTGSGDDVPVIIGRDADRDLAVVAVPPRAEDLVTPRSGPPRPGPRYVAVVDATQHGPAIRPLYIGRVELIQDPRTSSPLLSVAAAQQTLPRGAAIFALDGRFIGLVSQSGGALAIVPGESLRTFAEGAQELPGPAGDLGLDVQPLTPALARASGADRGVMLSYVQPRGPAAGVLSSGDVIQTIDEINVTTVAGFQRLASSRQPGKVVAITGVRKGEPLLVSVRAIEAGQQQLVSRDDDPGMTLRAVADVGLEVVVLQPSTPAARADLRPGDIIVAVDGRPEPDAATLARAYRAAPGGGAVLLTVRRGTTQHVVALEKP